MWGLINYPILKTCGHAIVSFFLYFILLHLVTIAIKSARSSVA